MWKARDCLAGTVSQESLDPSVNLPVFELSGSNRRVKFLVFSRRPFGFSARIGCDFLGGNLGHATQSHGQVQCLSTWNVDALSKYCNHITQAVLSQLLSTHRWLQFSWIHGNLFMGLGADGICKLWGLNVHLLQDIQIERCICVGYWGLGVNRSSGFLHLGMMSSLFRNTSFRTGPMTNRTRGGNGLTGNTSSCIITL